MLSPNALGAILTEQTIAALEGAGRRGRRQQPARDARGRRAAARSAASSMRPITSSTPAASSTSAPNISATATPSLVRQRIEGIPVRLEQIWAESAEQRPRSGGGRRRYGAAADRQGHNARGAMHALANPARFLRFARPATSWLLLIGLALAVAGMVAGLTLTPPDYLQGETVRILYIHVPVGLARHGRVAGHCRGVGQPARLAPSAGGGRRAGGRAGGRDLRRDLPRHRLDLGPADLGHLVGMGRAADLDADPVLPLPRLHRAGLGRARARRGGADRRDLRPGRRDQPADHPLFGAVVAHASPGPEHRHHRLDASTTRSCGRCR